MNFNKSQGFTLIEVVASIVILSMVLILGMSIFSQMEKTNSNSKENLDTANISKELLFELKKINFANINNTSISEINKNFPIEVKTLENNSNNLSLIGTYQYLGKVYGVNIYISKVVEIGTRSHRRVMIEIKNSRNNISSTVHGYLTN